jgi:hypothetical protein
MFIKFNEYLKESVNDDLLYHWLSLEKISNLLNKNILYGKFKHTINGVEYIGNSFSRNKHLKIDYYTVRLTCDKDKLKQNYKIMPLDGEIIHRKIDTADDYKYNKNKDRNPKKTNVFGDQPIKKDFHIHRFDEEFILGDIKNISKYIKSVDVYEGNWYSEKNSDDDIINLEKYCIENNISFNKHF